MTYPGAVRTTASEYAIGYSEGVAWAEADKRDWIPPHATIHQLEESIDSEHRPSRAFYLGALRGYRATVRTRDTRGRWGT